MNIDRVSLLGVQVSAINMDLALAQIDTLITERHSSYVCVAPAHSIMDCVNNPDLLPVFNNAGMVTPDGMSVVWFLRSRGYKKVDRVYGPDLLLAACAHGLARGWRHFFLGGAPETLEMLLARLRSEFPELEIAGHICPPFHSLSHEECENIINEINKSKTDILWIGLGSPRQEIWMNNNLDKIKAGVMVGVGAAFDFLSGGKPQAPYWIQRAGLEWLFRLLSEPKRLWPRYRQYPKFVIYILLQYLGLRKF